MLETGPPPRRGALVVALLQRPEPVSDSQSDRIGRIFLEVVDAGDRDFLLPRPAAAEVHDRTFAENRPRLAFDEQLRYRARRQPLRIVADDRVHVGRLAVDGDLARPRQRRPAGFTWLQVWSTILGHLIFTELTQNGAWQGSLDEQVLV